MCMMHRLNHGLRLSKILPQHRTCTTSMTYLHKIFVKPDDPPPPPSWPKPALPSFKHVTSTLQWGTPKEQTLRRALQWLQDTLRYLHKRQVPWPTEGSFQTNLAPDEYLATLLHPLVGLFKQICQEGVMNKPMEYVPIAFGESIFGGTFIADDFTRGRITAPIALCMPDDLFDTTGKVSSRTEYALSKAFEYHPTMTVPFVIVTNFKEIAVFWRETTRGKLEVVFEPISTTQPALALKVFMAACLHRTLFLHHHYISNPDPDDEVETDLVGPPNDPNRPLLPDEEILRTHHRNSDFDFVTLIHDRARALQFLRWHVLLRERYSKVVVQAGDVLTGMTNDVGMDVPDTRPIYPYDESLLPADTVAHLRVIQREEPLKTAGIQDAFNQSKSFTLKIESVIDEGSKRGVSTVYRCRIVSIEGHVVSSPPLCLKLFDDRFQLLEVPDEDDLLFQDEHIPLWFRPMIIAELYALNEKFAYDKLLPVQGTVIPWFYGMHRFTLPNDTVLYGLLMEYIAGGSLSSDLANDMSPERQIRMIRSIRHAARVLDVADVAQRDWHSGQILLHTNRDTHIEHAVLVDLASTTQTWDPYDPNLLNNWFGAFQVLIGSQSPLDYELVWEYFVEPDDWDAVCAIMNRYRREDSPSLVLTARDMFPYITFL